MLQVCPSNDVADFLLLDKYLAMEDFIKETCLSYVFTLVLKLVGDTRLLLRLGKLK